MTTVTGVPNRSASACCTLGTHSSSIFLPLARSFTVRVSACQSHPAPASVPMAMEFSRTKSIISSWGCIFARSVAGWLGCSSSDRRP